MGLVTLIAVPVIAIGSVLLISKVFNSKKANGEPIDARGWAVTERARNLGDALEEGAER